DGGELVGQPRIVGAGGVPQVVVGVDHVCPVHDGTGASERSRPSARRSSHRAAGIPRRNAVGYSSRWAGVRTPATRPVTAGCAKGNWIAAARTGTPWRSQTVPSRRARPISAGGAGR